jgi:predicted transcriptional regulator
VADYSPFYSGGAVPFTATTAGAVTGGNVLIWSAANVVTVSGADSTAVCGVAAHDAASGAKVTVWPIDGVIHNLVASGAITALAGVVSDTAGQVKTATIATAAAAATLIGVAVTTAAGSPLVLRVQGRR